MSLGLFLLILSLYAVTACQRGPEPAPSQPEIQPQTTAESVTVPTLRPSQTPAPSQTPTETSIPSPTEIILPSIGVEMANAFFGQYALTAAGEHGLYVRALYEADNRKAVAHLDFPAWEVVVREQFAYVLSCERNCVWQIDLSNPEKPIETGNFYLTGLMQPVIKMLAGEEFLYLAVETQEIQILSYSLGTDRLSSVFRGRLLILLSHSFSIHLKSSRASSQSCG